MKDRGTVTLTRNVGDTIRVGDDIEVRLVLVAGRRARISVTAPLAVKIVRGEATAVDERAAK